MTWIFDLIDWESQLCAWPPPSTNGGNGAQCDNPVSKRWHPSGSTVSKRWRSVSQQNGDRPGAAAQPQCLTASLARYLRQQTVVLGCAALSRTVSKRWRSARPWVATGVRATAPRPYPTASLVRHSVSKRWRSVRSMATLHHRHRQQTVSDGPPSPTDVGFYQSRGPLQTIGKRGDGCQWLDAEVRTV